MIYTVDTHQYCKLMLPSSDGDIIVKYVQQWNDETKIATVIKTRDNTILVKDGEIILEQIHLPDAYIVDTTIDKEVF